MTDYKHIEDEKPPEGVEVEVRKKPGKIFLYSDYKWWFCNDGLHFIHIHPDDEWRPYESAGE